MYEKSFLKNLPPLRREYFQFRNEETLKLIKQKTVKNLIDGIVNVNWRLFGRHKALQKINSMEIHYDTRTANPFEKYDRMYKRKQEEIIEIDKTINEKQDEFTEKLQKGLIDSSSRRTLRELIDTFKKKRDLVLVEIDIIGKNWDTAMRKWIRTGPPKKRGRKPKTTIVYKTARELKKKMLLKTKSALQIQTNLVKKLIVYLLPQTKLVKKLIVLLISQTKLVKKLIVFLISQTKLMKKLIVYLISQTKLEKKPIVFLISKMQMKSSPKIF